MKPWVVSRHFFLASILFSALIGSVPRAVLAASDAVALPLAFDPREKVPKPDLGALPQLRFVTTVDFPPFNFLDQSGKLSGFHVDLAREICRELAILDRCQIEAAPYAALAADLDKGESDIVAAGVQITPELRKNYDFSRVFLQAPARFAAPKRVSAAIRQPAQLGRDDLVGVVGATAHAAMLTRFFPNLKSRTFADRNALLAALKRGEIKAAFGDSLQLSFWLESDDAANCCDFLGGPFYSRQFLGEGLALMLPKDKPVIANAVNHALVALARNGRLSDLYLRYFPNGL